METITVKYSCNLCGVTKAEVAVPVRHPGEDVVKWVEQIVGCNIKSDHTRRSPHCKATNVQNLMIPLNGREMVGGPVVN